MRVAVSSSALLVKWWTVGSGVGAAETVGSDVGAGIGTGDGGQSVLPPNMICWPVYTCQLSGNAATLTRLS